MNKTTEPEICQFYPLGLWVYNHNTDTEMTRLVNQPQA